MASNEFNKLRAEVAKQKIEIADLRKKVTELSRFQQSFVKEEVIRREVTFKGKVRDATGAVVIN